MQQMPPLQFRAASNSRINIGENAADMRAAIVNIGDYAHSLMKDSGGRMRLGANAVSMSVNRLFTSVIIKPQRGEIVI